jgi:phosphate transport system ATP-binding protein
MTHSTRLRIVQPGILPEAAPAVNLEDFHVWFGEAHILRGIDVGLQEYRINCIVGPSGSGKSTLIRSINRMNDEAADYSFKGAIYVNGENILDKSVNVARLRTVIGMVFQKPCVFPKSVSENVLFGIQHLKKLSRQEKLQIVEDHLKSTYLWKEVSHRLHDNAVSLSIGQQQRLCIARALAVKPKVILLDEPTSSLDPVSTRAIEDLMLELKQKYTIVFVTHNIQQAQRVADHLIFMCNGRIIEQGTKQKLFSTPEKDQTRKYLNEEYCDCE